MVGLLPRTAWLAYGIIAAALVALARFAATDLRQMLLRLLLLVPFVIGGPNDKNSAIEVNRAQILIPGKRKRSYWFMDNRDR